MFRSVGVMAISIIPNVIPIIWTGGLMGALDVALPGAAGTDMAASLAVGGLSKAVYEAGLEHGIIVRPLAGCIVMAPPLIITEAEIDELARRLEAALDQVLADTKKVPETVG